MIATNKGMFLVEISLRSMDIQILMSFLKDVCIQSLAFIEPNKFLINDSINKKLIMFDADKK